MEKSIIDYYNAYDEEGRLFRNNSHKIEWLTSMHYLKKYIKKGSLLLDGCAGTGNYAFPFAKLGYKVVAGDIVPGNVKIMQEKQKKDPVLKEIYVGSMSDLSPFKKESFDAVLCMGAFYHVDEEERFQIMNECLRVLKLGGILAISYINNLAGVICGLEDDLGNVDAVNEWYHKKTKDGLFLFMNPLQIEEMALRLNTKILANIAADGVNYLLSDKLNSTTDENFDKWYRFHLETCEDKSLLGYSLHGLIILRK